VALNGTAVAPAGVSLSPVGTISFASTGVGLTAAAQTVTLTNNGGVALTIQSIAVSGDFAFLSAAGGTPCGASLAVGAACTVQVVFVPTAPGARTGSLTVVDNAAGSPQSLQLTGTGVDFALSASGSTASTVSAGSQAVYPLLLSSVAGLTGSVVFTCAPVPAGATCLVNPSPGVLGGTSSIAVTVATSVAGASLRWPVGPGERQVVWLAALLPLGLLALRRRGLRRLGGVAMLGCVLLVAGCGASRLVPGTDASTPVGNVTPTPTGTYNLVVAGTSAGLTRSVGLTLIVQ
jgi:hypothetical protein